MNTAELPLEIRAKLAELELELSEGDITEKGYQKKRAKLLEPYEKQSPPATQYAQSPSNIPSAAPRRGIGSGLNADGSASPSTAQSSGATSSTSQENRRERRRNGRRYTRDDMRYRSASGGVKVSKVREEAVKEALSRLKEQGGGPEPVFMMNKRRTNATPAPTVAAHTGGGDAVSSAPSRETRNQMFSDTDDDDDDDDDDDSTATLEGQSSSASSRRSTVPGPTQPPPQITPPAAHRPVPTARSHQRQQPPQQLTSGSQSQVSTSSPQTSTTTNTAGTPTGGMNSGQHVIVGNNYKGMPSNTSRLESGGSCRNKASHPPPDVTSSTSTLRRADILIGENGGGGTTGTQSSPNVAGDIHAVIGAGASQVGASGTNTGTTGSGQGSVRVSGEGPFRTRVSAKIEQLVNTLKRPKRRPLNEYFVDEEEGVIAKPRLDSDAPRPQGPQIEPAVGDPLAVPSGLPRNLESALDHGSPKSPAITVLDKNAKPSCTLTYIKLKSRAYKIAYNLLNKLGPRGELSLKPRDRVALAFPNNDPIGFASAFYGCLLADVVPVPIEVPPPRRDSTCKSMGFLLSSLDVRVVLTSEDCYKYLPRTAQSSSGQPEIAPLSGWPRVHWSVTDSMTAKPPKDWRPPQRLKDDDTAYIEYTYGRDGSVRGVMYSRAAVVEHCRTLTVVCGYMESDVVVCVLDYKREAGLWHGLLASVFNACHVIFVPYTLMKEDPASWLRMVTRYKAGIALAKSRDMHWALLAQSEHKEVNLASLRMLLVADGANPWSLTSCDSFLNVFQARGLRPEALCPCAASSETLTLAVRRPGRQGGSNVGRGVLSMQGLSYGVVRVEAENCLRSLTLQDCGQVPPAAEAVVVRPGGAPYLCKQDEVGELCLRASYSGSGYWGLQGQTNAYFRVCPLGADGRPAVQGEFVRTGLLGFLGPSSSVSGSRASTHPSNQLSRSSAPSQLQGGLIFVCGSMEGLMTVTGRRHNTDDIIATILAVEPMKFVYRGRIAVFSQTILKDERIIIVAEQRPDCTEQASIQWMSRVLQAIDSIHQVGVYCLALVPPNHLPKTPLGGVHVFETQSRFTNGTLHPSNVLMCPHTCVTNIPQLRESQHHGGGGSMGHGGGTPSVGPSAMMVGSLVQGARLASAQGREMSVEDEDEGSRRFQFLSEILQWRASATPDHRLYTVVNAKTAQGGVNKKVQESGYITCLQLHKKAEKIGSMLLEKAKLAPGAHVALLYPAGIELVCAVYGCLYAGCVPVPIRPPHPHNLATTLPTCKMSVECAHAAAILTCSAIYKVLKTKDACSVVDFKTWPVVLDTDENYRKRMTTIYRSLSAEQEICYLDFSVSTTGTLSGIRMTHATASALCRSQKLQCELYPAREVALCLDPYSGLGFALWCLSGIYCGHHSILVPPMELELNPALWLTVCANRQVRDTFCSYGVMELCTRELGQSTPMLKAKGVSLSSLRSLVVVAEERPRLQLTNSFSKLFASLGLSPRAVSTSFGCRVNVAICLQGASSPDITTVYVDTWSLRNDRVKMLEKGSPHSLCLMESGKLLPGVKVVIANPDTFGHCADSHLGEIWVSSPHNASGYYSVFGSDTDLARQQAQHFNARLATGDTDMEFARTGYLGFVRRTELTQSDGERHDALFVVGSLDEAIFLRGQCFHPIDLEATVVRCHRRIVESAVFVWANLLVVVVELDGPEHEALDLVPLVTTAILEEHYLIVGVVVVVDPGSVLINSRGEKQRVHLRDSFLGDKLDPIYVAYNM